jgi:hypothetical protein
MHKGCANTHIVGYTHCGMPPVQMLVTNKHTPTVSVNPMPLPHLLLTPGGAARSLHAVAAAPHPPVHLLAAPVLAPCGSTRGTRGTPATWGYLRGIHAGGAGEGAHACL